MGVDQISQLRSNFTISAKFHNPGILGIPGVMAVPEFLRCFGTVRFGVFFCCYAVRILSNGLRSISGDEIIFCKYF